MLNAERDNKYIAEEIIKVLFENGMLYNNIFCKSNSINYEGLRYTVNKINKKCKGFEIGISAKRVFLKQEFKTKEYKDKYNEIISKFNVPKRNSFTISSDCIELLNTLMLKPRSISSLASKFYLYCPQSWVNHLVSICIGCGADIALTGSILSFNNASEYDSIKSKLINYNAFEDDMSDKAPFKPQKGQVTKEVIVALLKKYDWEMREPKDSIRFLNNNLDINLDDAVNTYWEIRKEYMKRGTI